MGELIQVQVGQCGNRIGTRYWEMLCAEHGLDASGTPINDSEEVTYGRKVSFSENSDHRYTPRALLVDMEPGTLDSIRAGPNSRLFPSDHYICEQVGTGNLFPRGHYGVGGEFSYSVLDAVRHLVEACDSFQGFQFVHSIGGGTGSGLGTRLILQLTEEYCNRMLNSYTVFPSDKVSDIVVEPYNACLSIHQLVENVDMTMVLDNEAILDICNRKLEIESPSYADFNHLLASTMSGISCPMRFKGILNSNLRKMGVSLVPYPRLHFFTTEIAPMCNRNCTKTETTVPELLNSLFEFKNQMDSYIHSFAFKPSAMTSYAIFRGNISSYEVETCLKSIPIIKSGLFSAWIPDPICCSICSVAPLQSSLSASVITNSDFIMEVFKRNQEKFTCMFRRKAFLHWYTAEGMDEMEFNEAESNADDMISEYQMMRGYCFSEGSEDEEEEQES